MESKTFIEGKDLAWEPSGKGMSRHIMGYNDDLMVVEVKFEQGGLAPMHQHPHTQSSYIVSGKYEFTVDGEMKVVQAGDGVLVKPKQQHMCKCLEPGIVIDTFSPARVDFL